MRKIVIKIILCMTVVIMAFQLKENTYNPKNLPQQVKEKFQSMYPGCKEGVDWTKKMARYQADFVYHDKSISLLFNKHGDLLNYKIEIDSSEVPEVVFLAIKKGYLDENYKIIYLMKRWEKGGVLLYETAIMKGRKFYILRNDVTGKLTNEYVIDKTDILNPYYGKD